MLHQNETFDRYIIVGGYQYQVLQKFIDDNFMDLADRIILVNNDRYMEFGSGFSLFKGLETVLGTDFDELVFAEGDLFVDKESFQKVVSSPKDVVTLSPEPIFADQSVAFYLDTCRYIHYIYDTGHSVLQIQEPFVGVFNSGQIWKLSQPDRLRKVFQEMSAASWQGTNLVFIQKYFQHLVPGTYEVIPFKKWVNCNTLADFNRIDME